MYIDWNTNPKGCLKQCITTERTENKFDVINLWKILTCFYLMLKIVDSKYKFYIIRYNQI